MGTEARNENDGQHRLSDMVVEEVSFVDRGANRKRFLVVKRETGMATELVSDGRGGMKRVTKNAGDGADVDKKKKPPAPPFKPKDEAEMDDEEKRRKAAGEGGGDEDEEDDAEKANKASDGNETESDEEFEDGKKKNKPAEKTTKGSMRKGMLAGVTEAIELLMDVAEDLKDGGDDEEEEGDYEPPAAVTANAKKALGLISKLAGVQKSDDDVNKSGRRMSKERLDRFSKTIGDLHSILKEVMASPELKDDAEKRDAAILKAFAKVAKASAGSGAIGDTSELVAAIKELTEHAREQDIENGRLRKRLEVMRKGGAVSNSLGVDSREGTSDRGDGVEWPFDLNAPIDREHTEKDTSFYEE